MEAILNIKNLILKSANETGSRTCDSFPQLITIVLQNIQESTDAVRKIWSKHVSRKVSKWEETETFMNLKIITIYLSVLDKEDMTQFSIWIVNNWCQIMSLEMGSGIWLEVNRNIKEEINKSVLRLTDVHRITIDGTAFGSFQTTGKFVCHDKIDKEIKAIFDHNIQTLTLQCFPFMLELHYDYLEKLLIVDQQTDFIYIYISLLYAPKIWKCHETFFQRSLDFLSINILTIGQSSVLALKINREYEEENIDKILYSKLSLNVFSLLLRFKKIGFNINYTSVKTVTDKISYSFSELGFKSFEATYAWMHLLMKGFIFTDRLNSKFLGQLKSLDEDILIYSLYYIKKKLDSNKFYNLELALSEAIDLYPFHNYNTETVPLTGSFFNLMRDVVGVPRVVITPTRLLCLKPIIIKSNRIIRQYGQKHFIKVIFREETFQKFSSISKSAMFHVINKIRNILNQGIKIGDWHFEFLACSNSQLREHGCWMVVRNDKISANLIRSHIDMPKSERCVAKFMSRVGQWFSSSKEAISISIESGSCQKIPDIKTEDGQYIFSDGIGKMSLSVRDQIVIKLNIPGNAKPSAFQIRYGGCKGVLVVDPLLEGDVICIRPSMEKFKSSHTSLEIVEFSKPVPLFLSRQVILLLSTLGIPDGVFQQRQKELLYHLGTSLLDDKEAKNHLNISLLKVNFKSLSKKGVILTCEPFFRSLLMVNYRNTLGSLQERSRIPILDHEGRLMMGVLDETQTLNYGEVFIQYSKHINKAQKEIEVIESTVVVTKHPCLHPGDVRKFQAVGYIPALSHIVDCIVFPSKGKRPHPDEISGSDLDGDMYFVCWALDLIFEGDNFSAMDYPKGDPVLKSHSITTSDMIDFTAENIVNLQLGPIANSHLAFADSEKKSVRSENCLELAKLHSIAVDSNKTGKFPNLPKKLHPNKYPDFMGKMDKSSYPSTNVLGKLFRQFKTLQYIVKHSPITQNWLKLDKLNEKFIVEGSEMFTETANISYKNYCKKLNAILSAFNIQNEAEIMSGILLKVEHLGYIKQEQFEIMDIIQTLTESLVSTTRTEFFEEFGGEERALSQSSSLERNRMAQKASAWYFAAYGNSSKEVQFLSFPWIISDMLPIIKEPTQHCPLDYIAKNLNKEFANVDAYHPDILTVLNHGEINSQISSKPKYKGQEDMMNNQSIEKKVNDWEINIEDFTEPYEEAKDIHSTAKIEKNDEVQIDASAQKHTKLKNGQETIKKFKCQDKVKSSCQMSDKEKVTLIQGKEILFEILKTYDLEIKMFWEILQNWADNYTLSSNRIFLAKLVFLYFYQSCPKTFSLVNNLIGFFQFIFELHFKWPSFLENNIDFDSNSLSHFALLAYHQLAVYFGFTYLGEEMKKMFGHILINVSEDVLRSVEFADDWFMKLIANISGAEVSIRRRHFQNGKGLFIEACGTMSSLLKVEALVDNLNLHFINFRFLMRFQILEYKTIFEGLVDLTKKNIFFMPYLGDRNPNHHSSSCFVAYLVDPQPRTLDLYIKLLWESIPKIQNVYWPHYHGDLKAVVRFQHLYIIDSKNVFKPENNLWNYEEYLKLELRHAMRSANVDDFLPFHNFIAQLDFSHIEEHFHVSLKYYPSLPNYCLILLDPDFNIEDLRFCDVRWLVLNIKKQKQNIPDVRIKLASRRRLTPNDLTARTDRINNLLQNEAKLLHYSASGELTPDPYWGKYFSMVRHKRMSVYTSSSIPWLADTKIFVSEIDEYSYNCKGENSKVKLKELSITTENLDWFDNKNTGDFINRLANIINNCDVIFESQTENISFDNPVISE